MEIDATSGILRINMAIKSTSLHEGFPDFLNGFLVSVGDRWPGDKGESENFWLVHPDGNDFNGPFDSYDEAKSIAKILISPLRNDTALADLFEEIEDHIKSPGLYGISTIPGLYGISTIVEAYKCYLHEMPAVPLMAGVEVDDTVAWLIEWNHDKQDYRGPRSVSFDKCSPDDGRCTPLVKQTTQSMEGLQEINSLRAKCDKMDTALRIIENGWTMDILEMQTIARIGRIGNGYNG